MSGGSLEHPDSKLAAVAAGLERSIEQGRNHPALRRRLAEHMYQCAEVLRRVDLADSGDTGPDDWVDGAERLLARCPGDPPS